MITITREFTKEQLIATAKAEIASRRYMIESGEWGAEAVGFYKRKLALSKIALASLEAEPVAWIVHSRGGDQLTTDANYVANAEGMGGIHSTPVYAAPPTPEDYFSSLVTAARLRADKAMRKFPQPNYVLNKVAEESGEVIKEVIHYTEGRGDWNKVEYELIDNLAMLIRLVTEGDQVIGFTPPAACRAAIIKSKS